uniref:Uncharacterized protein n=1 Tax=Romanomermis culicivorax TaxID=13658 RepID=A0A915HX61_ROMCU
MHLKYALNRINGTERKTISGMKPNEREIIVWLSKCDLLMASPAADFVLNKNKQTMTKKHRCTGLLCTSPMKIGVDAIGVNFG